MSSGKVFEVEAILFDMDGTIVDSSIPVRRVWSNWALGAGVDVEQVLATMPGRRAIEVMELLAPHMPQPETVDRFFDIEALDMEGTVEIPGALEFLSSLPLERWSVVTSATQGIARARIRAAGLPDPNVIVSADMVTRGKPHPECFLMAAAQLGIAPERCLAFEDAPAGVQAAQAAGMIVVGLETHYAGAQLGAPAAIADFRSVSAERQPNGGIRVELSRLD